MMQSRWFDVKYILHGLSDRGDVLCDILWGTLNLSYIVWEIFCVGYAKSLLYSMGDILRGVRKTLLYNSGDILCRVRKISPI